MLNNRIIIKLLQARHLNSLYAKYL